MYSSFSLFYFSGIIIHYSSAVTASDYASQLIYLTDTPKREKKKTIIREKKIFLVKQEQGDVHEIKVRVNFKQIRRRKKKKTNKSVTNYIGQSVYLIYIYTFAHCINTHYCM